MMNSECPVCQRQDAFIETPTVLVPRLQVNCPRCGHYTTTPEARDLLASGSVNGTQRANLSGFLRELDSFGFTSQEVRRLLNLRTPSVAEKGDKLLNLLASREPTPGRRITLQCDDPANLARTWTWDLNELSYLARDVLASGLSHLNVTGSPFLSNNAMEVQIAPAGWARLSELRDRPTTSRIGFVAMWFDSGMHGVRDNGIIPAIRDAGYEPKLINQHDHVNRIDDEIISLIRQSKFIVADFTGSRGGVYFEAGFALGLGLPVIWTCTQDQLEETDNQKKLHFDVNHFNFLPWTNDAGGHAELKDKLQRRIEAVVGVGPGPSA